MSAFVPDIAGPRRLGALEVSPLAWGMWRFGGQSLAEARALVDAALAAGLSLFDTADCYGEPFGAAEALLGGVLAEAPSLRDRIVLASKGGIEPGSPYNGSAVHLTAACEASLRRLGVDRLDLYQVHRPDTLTHPAETAAALAALRAAGKIGEVGVSNHTPAQVEALQAYLPFPLASTQPEFSPLALEPLYDGVLDQALRLKLAVLAWSPLGGGRLARGEGGSVLGALIDRLANQAGVTPAALACAWLMHHPARPIPIIGSQSAERIAHVVLALGVRLSRADWYAILAAARGVPLP